MVIWAPVFLSPRLHLQFAAKVVRRSTASHQLPLITLLEYYLRLFGEYFRNRASRGLRRYHGAHLEAVAASTGSAKKHP